EAVVALTHRGAVNADPLTGDGSGLSIQVPFELLREDAAALGREVHERDQLAVAVVFLPVDEQQRPAARAALEEQVRAVGIEVIGWRVVPTDPSVLGPQAGESLPGIEHLLMLRPDAI